MTERTPLVTFALFAYNQEKYVREAVQGALSQDYDNLEILISDDCSDDSTFEIINQMVDGYGGPHKIVVNRNQTNLGIGDHINQLMKLSHGSFVVIAAGDDVSHPSRTSCLVDAWIGSGRKAKSVYSDAQIIDETGNEIGRMEREYGRTPTEVLMEETIINGCAHGWDREIFERFGPLAANVVSEDVVLPFRSLLLGEVVRVPKLLVNYRECESIWKRSERSYGNRFAYNRFKQGVCRIATYGQIISDIREISDTEFAPDDVLKLEKLALQRKMENQLFVDLIDNGLLKSTWKITRSLLSTRWATRGFKRYWKLRRIANE